MGLYKIDNVSSEEWHRRMMRKHNVERILITLGEILLMAATVVWLVYVASQIRP